MLVRSSAAIAIVVILSSLSSAGRVTTCRRQHCASATASRSAPCRGYATACKCVLEWIETYAVPGGGSESRYLAERHDDGCTPDGDCQYPATIYITGNLTGTFPEDCTVQGSCSARLGKCSCNGLKEPKAAGHMPEFAGRLGEIAKILDTHYIAFDSQSSQGCVRAIVHLVYLPVNAEIRPNQPARVLALGYEVRNVPAGATCYEVPCKYVRQCEDNSCQYYVNTGGVTYAVMTSLTP